MSKQLGIADFLGHQSREGGGNFLRGWKKRTPPVVDFWLHTRAPIVALWQHQFPRVVEREDKQTKRVTREVWTRPFNCWEPEETLRKQYMRDQQTGERTAPPEICPGCRLIEAVRSLVDAGHLSWVEEIFKWTGSDPTKAVVVHAGGLYNAFGSDKLEPDQVDEMRAAGISPKHAWKENAMSKCNYVFRVVDHAEPEGGIQVAIETTLLGDKTKAVIRDTMTSRGEEEGNPLLHPYAIRWEHKPLEKAFGDKYHALRMDKLQLTDTVRSLIEDAEPPSIDRVIAPGNVRTLRADLERAYIGPKGTLDWDWIFGPSEDAAGPGGEPDDDRPPDVDHKRSEVRRAAPPPPKAEPETEAEERVAGEPAQLADDDDVECDECGALMKAAELVCGTCGFDYTPQAPAEPEPPPPPRRMRSAAAQPAHQAAAAAAGGNGAAPSRAAPRGPAGPPRGKPATPPPGAQAAPRSPGKRGGPGRPAAPAQAASGGGAAEQSTDAGGWPSDDGDDIPFAICVVGEPTERWAR